MQQTTNYYTFEYYDSKNDLKMNVKLNANEKSKDLVIFEAEQDFYYKGKKYTVKEFKKLDKIIIDNDYGFGNTFITLINSLQEIFESMRIKDCTPNP